MPGLKYAHLNYHFEGEAENHWRTGGGTPEEYVEFLKIFYQAIKEANPNAFVFSAGFNLGDVFDINNFECFNNPPTAEGPEVIQFINAVLSNPELPKYSDVIGVNCNHHYKGLPLRMKWINSFNLNKPAWCVDMAAGYEFNVHWCKEPEYPNEEEIVAILENPGHPKFKETWDWGLAEQAKYTFKKIIAAAGSGYGKLSFQWILEDPYYKSHIKGILEDKIPDIGIAEGTPRPIFYNIKLFNEKVGGFDSVNDLNPLSEGVDPNTWTWTIRFTKDSNNVLVLWHDGGQKTVDLSPHISTSNAKITHIVTELDGNNDPIYPDNEVYPADSILVSETPIFVEAHNRADTNQDGEIDMPELLTFIDRWKVSRLDVSMPELMEAISIWKDG
jgi:hypothetical protein